MDLPEVAKLTMEEEEVQENFSARRSTTKHYSARSEAYRELEEVRVKVTSHFDCTIMGGRCGLAFRWLPYQRVLQQWF
jgi:hypothetical protein